MGGNPAFAYPYIIKKGLSSDAAYPYEGTGDDCRESTIQSVASLRGFRLLPENNEALLMQWLAQTPVAVGVCGTAPSFLMYSGGVYDDVACGDTLNHALLLVGYGETAQGQAYWVAKNSWCGRLFPNARPPSRHSVACCAPTSPRSAAWGERGYVRLARQLEGAEPEGICGLAKAPSFAVGGYGGDAGGDSSGDGGPFVTDPAAVLRLCVGLGFLFSAIVAGLVLAATYCRSHLVSRRQQYSVLPPDGSQGDIEFVMGQPQAQAEAGPPAETAGDYGTTTAGPR